MHDICWCCGEDRRFADPEDGICCRWDYEMTLDCEAHMATEIEHTNDWYIEAMSLVMGDDQ
jgi:hypothetical protein